MLVDQLADLDTFPWEPVGFRASHANLLAAGTGLAESADTVQSIPPAPSGLSDDHQTVVKLR
ncbi:hypothetical protein ACFQ2M_14295 [Kitasatospora saccharophila]|uniref:hypothetical protein n=1 Tax=Kitasatospora saccharophila TaxID=407973 RepID=UPI0031DA4390